MRTCVGMLNGGTTAVEAVVDGTRRYTVRLAAGPRNLRFECSCPMGEDGAFCKHAVAVALAWLETQTTSKGGEPSAGIVESPARRGRGRSKPDLEAWLRRQTPETLVKLVLDAANDDRRMMDRLLLAAASSATDGIPTAAIRSAITRATATRGFVEYRDARGFVGRIHDAVDLLEELAINGHPDAVVELSEHAIRRVERATSFRARQSATNPSSATRGSRNTGGLPKPNGPRCPPSAEATEHGRPITGDSGSR